MSAITFGDKDPWVVARWAFFGLLAQVLESVSQEEDLRGVLEQAMALDGLHFALEDPGVSRRLASTLLTVADEVLDGKRLVSVEGRGVLDGDSQVMFRRAVTDLRGRLRRFLEIS